MSLLLPKKSSDFLKKGSFFFICHGEGFGDIISPMDNAVHFYESL